MARTCSDSMAIGIPEQGRGEHRFPWAINTTIKIHKSFWTGLCLITPDILTGKVQRGPVKVQDGEVFPLLNSDQLWPVHTFTRSQWPSKPYAPRPISASLRKNLIARGYQAHQSTRYRTSISEGAGCHINTRCPLINGHREISDDEPSTRGRIIIPRFISRALILQMNVISARLKITHSFLKGKHRCHRRVRRTRCLKHARENLATDIRRILTIRTVDIVAFCVGIAFCDVFKDQGTLGHPRHRDVQFVNVHCADRNTVSRRARQNNPVALKADGRATIRKTQSDRFVTLQSAAIRTRKT